MSIQYFFARVRQYSQLLVLTRHYRVHDHLTSYRSDNQVIDFIIANKIVVIHNLGALAFITIQNVLARAPKILAFDVQGSNGFGMASLQLEELLTFLCHTFDTLADRVEDAKLLLAGYADHYAHYL